MSFVFPQPGPPKSSTIIRDRGNSGTRPMDHSFNSFQDHVTVDELINKTADFIEGIGSKRSIGCAVAHRAILGVCSVQMRRRTSEFRTFRRLRHQLPTWGKRHSSGAAKQETLGRNHLPEVGRYTVLRV